MTWQAAAREQARAFLTSGRARLGDELISKLSAPFIGGIPPEWDSASKRILLVGQETFGWGGGADLSDPVEQLSAWVSSEDVDGLLRCFEDFDFGQEYKSTPLWAFHRRLAAAAAEHYRAVGWTNLVRVDTGPMNRSTRSSWANLTFEELDLVCDWQIDLFRAEFQAIAPEVVVFVTGPHYDYVIKKMFGDVHFARGSELLTEREFARVVAPSLPLKSFRTYHPAYLRRRRRTDIEAQVKLAIIDAERAV